MEANIHVGESLFTLLNAVCCKQAAQQSSNHHSQHTSSEQCMQMYANHAQLAIKSTAIEQSEGDKYHYLPV